MMIPKPDGGERPLGIPTIRDRVAQQAAKLVVEPIFEADFEPNAYGYRPKRGALARRVRWRILVSSGPQHFITTDNPAFFFHEHGLGSRESELSFPLSKTHALHGSWQAAGSDLVFAKAQQRIVKEINRRLASQTERLAFYYESASWLSKILPKKYPYLSAIHWSS